MNDRAEPLRVLHVAETAKGGVGSYMDDVASLQIERGGPDSVRVVLPDTHAVQLRRVPLASQRRFPAAERRPVNALRMVAEARRQIRDWRPDVVHLQSSLAGLALRPLLALGRRRPRVVYCSHGWAFDREGHRAANRVYEILERVCSRWCDRVVCVSSYELAAGERIGIDPRRLALVDNGIPDVTGPGDVDGARRRWPAGRRRVLFVGRLDRQKGVDVFFDAMRRLEGQAHAVVVGSAVVADEAMPATPPNVDILGWLPREEIPAFYAAAEVVVISSRWEAFSLVAVEAMRAGRAVVATTVGGLQDVVVDGRTGRVVSAEDAEALSAAVEGLTPGELAEMGAAGRRRYDEHFRIERVVDELDAIYRG